MEMKKIDAGSFREALKKNQPALLPLGAVEVHGAHLPIGTDSFLAEALCHKLAERGCGIVLPTLHYSQVWSLGDQIGSMSISQKLLISLLTEILLEIRRNGFSMAVIVNTHLGNAAAMKEAARLVLAQAPDFKVLYFSYPGASEKLGEVMESPNFHGSFFHADEIETSYMLYLCGEYVDMSKAINGAPRVPKDIDVTPVRWSSFTDTAVMGDATRAAASKGEAVIEHVLNVMADYIKEADRNGYERDR